jgi:predicted DNA-binding WGR domain protein
MARVNKFLLKAGGTKVKAAYVQDDDLMKMAKGGEILGIKYTISKGESDDERIVTFEEGQYRDIQIEPHDAIFHKTWGRMGGQGWAHINEFGFTYPTIREAIKSYLEDKRRKKYPIVTKKQGGSTLLAPNGHPSNLTAEQYKLVRTPQFKDWFGDWENDPQNASKVVDDNGEPLVVYHGSDYVFNVFKTNKQIYFATNKEYASEISESGRVKSFFINIRNLLDATKFYIDDYSYREYKTFLKKNGIDVKIISIDNEIVSKFWYLISNSSIWKSIKEKYDGFSMYENMYATKGKIEEEDFDDPFTKVYVCFESNQIKLADGSNTTFDGSNPDVRYAIGGSIDEIITCKNCGWSWEESQTTPSEKYICHKCGFDNEPNDDYAEGGKTFNDKELLAKWKRGESIGFTATAHLKAKGLIPRSDGEKRKSPQYKRKGGLIGGFEDLEDEWLSKKIEIFLDKVKPIKFYFVDPNTNTLTVGFDKYYSQDAAQKVYEQATSSKEFFHAPSVESTYDSKTGDLVFKIKLKKPVEYGQGGEVDEKVIRERWAKKKDSLMNMADNIRSLRTNLRKDLKGDDDKDRLTALAISLMDKTAERVGNNESEANGHLGITGLSKRNVKVEGNTITLKYIGKSGVKQEKQFSDEGIASALKDAIANSQSKYVFETSDGFRIKNDRINRYLNEYDISAKDLRGYSANQWIVSKLREVKDKEILGDEAKRKKKFNEIVKSVAEKVGHGAPTLKKHYMLPSLEREWVNNGKIVDLANIKRAFKRGGDVGVADINQGANVVNNIDYDPLDETQDIPNDGEGVFKDGGELKFNDIVLYHEKNGNWFVPKNTVYAWLYQDPNAAKKLESGEFDFVLFPPNPPMSLAMSRGYVPPLLKIWTKKYQKETKGADNLLGIVKGWYDEKNKKLYIIMMTTRKDMRRKGVNSHIIKNLREEFKLDKDQIIFDKPTKEGEMFSKSGKYNHGGKVDLFEHYDELPKKVQAILEKYENEEPDYTTLESLQGELEEQGYTFEYGLDYEPYGLRKMAKGGEISDEEKKETYKKWKSLVNMSKSELEKFYNSEEGKVAGLSASQAKSLGIDSGRESARWIMKMKDTSVKNWTPTMWKWAKKQISFISRMSGNKGKLYDESGAKTRKHTSLLIWGHNPTKKAGGGELDIPIKENDMNEVTYNQLPAINDLGVGKKFVLKEHYYNNHNGKPTHQGCRYLIVENMGDAQMSDCLKLKVHHCYGGGGVTTMGIITRPIKNIMNKGRDMGESLASGVEKAFKKGGELDPDKKEVKQYFEHKSGAAGGLLVGKRHSEGGIQAINKSTGQPLEMEGGEVVITRDAVSDSTLHDFNGKQMTNREILSAINESGGGVKFAEGGDVSCLCSGKEYKLGGKTYKDYELFKKINNSYGSKSAIEKGMKVEDKEHGETFRMLKNGEITYEQFLKKLVVDHLSENPKYYDK